MGIRRGKTERVIGGTGEITRHSRQMAQRFEIRSSLSVRGGGIVGGGRWIMFL